MDSVNYLLSPPPTPSSSSASLPILVVSILGILTTAIVLVSYYVFVIICSINYHRQPNFSTSQDLPATTKSRGLEESAIRAIPTLRFKRNDEESSCNSNTRVFSDECSVCLGEFEEEEKLRFLPNCSHVFHTDCIGTWLQTSPNCPTCRAEINLRNPAFSLPLPTRNQDCTSLTIDVADEAGGDVSEQQNPSEENVGEREERLFSFRPIRRSFSVNSSREGKFTQTKPSLVPLQEILRQEQLRRSMFHKDSTKTRERVRQL